MPAIKTRTDCVALAGGKSIFCPALPPNMITFDSIWKARRAAFLEWMRLSSALPTARVCDHPGQVNAAHVIAHESWPILLADHLHGDGSSLPAGRSFNAMPTGNVRVSTYYHYTPSGRALVVPRIHDWHDARIFDIVAIPARYVCGAPAEDVLPVGISVIPTSAITKRELFAYTGYGVLARCAPSILPPSLTWALDRCRLLARQDRLPPPIYMAFGKRGGCYVHVLDGVPPAWSAPGDAFAASHIETMLMEHNRDGDHCYAMSRREWFARLEALRWGDRAADAARRLLRALSALPRDVSIQLLPPAWTGMPCSAIIQAVSIAHGRFAIARFRVLPDHLFTGSRAPSEFAETGLIPVLRMRRESIAVFEGNPDCARTIFAVANGRFLESLGALRAGVDAAHNIAVDIITDAAHGARPLNMLSAGEEVRARSTPAVRHDRKAWLTTADNAAAWAMMQLMAYALPTA